MTGVIDTHVHFWDTGHLRYPWLDNVDELGLPVVYGHGELLGDAAGVKLEGIVHVQAEMSHDLDPVIETEWLDGLTRTSPGETLPMRCIGYANLSDPQLSVVLHRHRKFPFFQGIRQEVWFDPRSTREDLPTTNFLDDPQWRAGFGVLADEGLLFEALAWHSQLPQLAVACAETGIEVVVNHLALHRFADDPREWERNLRDFAQATPRSSIKLSGLGMNSPRFDTDANEWAIRTAIDAFGPDRCMAASNFPVDSHAGGYGEYWVLLRTWISDLDVFEQEAILRGTAMKVYGFEAPTSRTNPASRPRSS